MKGQRCGIVALVTAKSLVLACALNQIVNAIGLPTASGRRALSVTDTTAGNWQIELVDTGAYGRAGRENSIALDGLGRPHISYCDGSLDCRAPKYAWHDGLTWHIETVDNQYDGGANSLALDSSDRPHISYLRWIGSSALLRYAWHDGAGWHTVTVDSNIPTASGTSLALDSTGRSHVAYHADPNPHSGGLLKYAWRDGSGWHTEVVDVAPAVLGGPSIALDDLDRPHISYTPYTPPDYSLKHAWRDGSGWHIETVLRREPKSSSIALDRQDRPHIIYNVGLYLQYAWNDGVGWHSQTVDSTNYVANETTSLALDNLDIPVVSY